MGHNDECTNALKEYFMTHFKHRALKLKAIQASEELKAYNETQLRDAALALHEKGVLRIVAKGSIPVTMLDFSDIQLLPK